MTTAKFQRGITPKLYRQEYRQNCIDKGGMGEGCVGVCVLRGGRGGGGT